MRKKTSEYQIAQLIYKSITNSIAPEEKIILDNWLQSHERNMALYNKIIDKDHIQDKLSIYNQIETVRIYKNLEQKIVDDKKKGKTITFFKIFKYAAVAVIFLGIGFLYQNGYFTKQQPLVAPNENITLQLENGTIKIIKEDGSSEIVDSKGNVVGSQKGTQLVYDTDAKVEKLVYNTLTVPYGKRFEILLSDGTNVHLNAGTSLKYPVKFIQGQQRQVYLMGEAYFDVAKDAKHPFIVNSDALNVQVLGTKFNVSSYPEDKETDVVLVEGSVNLYTEKDTNNTILLKPGFMGTFNKDKTSISTTPVITSIYTSWIHGEMVFRNMTFDNILKKMERRYNIDIFNNNADLANEKFNASFRDEPIEKILEYFKLTYDIDYIIQDNKVIINQ